MLSFWHHLGIQLLLNLTEKKKRKTTTPTGRMNAYMTQSDPVRIDDKILMEAVLEQLPQKQAKRLAQAEGIQFSDVLKLSLEYRCKKALFSNLPLTV